MTSPAHASCPCLLPCTDACLRRVLQMDIVAQRCEVHLAAVLQLLERYGVPQRQRRWAAASLMPLYMFLVNCGRWVGAQAQAGRSCREAVRAAAAAAAGQLRAVHCAQSQRLRHTNAAASVACTLVLRHCS